MYPYFKIFDLLTVFVFGLTLTICFFLFIWMLRKSASKFGFDFTIFRDNLLWFFLGTFFFARLFYVIFKWSDLKYIESWFQFFIDSDFNFSLYGAIFGFFGVLVLITKFSKEAFLKYFDGAVLSFLFVAVFGYLGSFFGGQVYGRETHMGIEILYNSAISNVPYEIPVFPLPFFYAGFTFIIFCVLYILSLFIHTRGFIGYVGAIAFASIMLVLEFFSGKYDVLRLAVDVNFNQVISLGIIGYCGYELYKLLQVHTGSKKVTIIK